MVVFLTYCPKLVNSDFSTVQRFFNLSVILPFSSLNSKQVASPTELRFRAKGWVIVRVRVSGREGIGIG